MRNFNEEIQKYPIYIIRNGKIERCTAIESVNDYNHATMQLHHCIKDYERNRAYYDERGIEQKLFLIPIAMHEQVHLRGIKTMSDEEFEDIYGVSRWKLIYNRKHED